MADELTTSEVAGLLSVKPKLLQEWARKGWVTPRGEGDGNGRRLYWSQKDVDDAMDLKNQESRKSAAEAFVDSLGGVSVMAHYNRALEQLDETARGSMFIVSSKGINRILGDESPAAAVRRAGGVAIILSAE